MNRQVLDDSDSAFCVSLFLFLFFFFYPSTNNKTSFTNIVLIEKSCHINEKTKRFIDVSRKEQGKGDMQTWDFPIDWLFYQQTKPLICGSRKGKKAKRVLNLMHFFLSLKTIHFKETRELNCLNHRSPPHLTYMYFTEGNKDDQVKKKKNTKIQN